MSARDVGVLIRFFVLSAREPLIGLEARKHQIPTIISFRPVISAIRAYDANLGQR